MMTAWQFEGWGLGMRDEVIEPFAVSEFFCDGLANFTVTNGIFRVTFYSLQVIPPARDPVKVAVARLAMPAEAVPSAAKSACSTVLRHNIVALFGGLPAVGC